jgi:hypothetical protein
MQLRPTTSVILYLGSYLPLSVILLVQDVRFERVGIRLCNPLIPDPSSKCELPLDHPTRAIGALIACVVAFAVALVALRLASPKRKIVIKESEHIPADLMNYTLPYVVAFMGLDYKDLSKLFGFLVFFFWIFVITYRSGQIVLNPVLAVLGWRLYDVKYVFEGGTETYSGTVLSCVTLHEGKAYRQAAIQDVLIVKEEAHDA